jgi:hypothetical protein
MNERIKHRRPSDVNQQVAKSVRPQLPRDGSKDGQNCLHGKMPAGYISTWDFSGSYDTKRSPTSGGGKGVI